MQKSPGECASNNRKTRMGSMKAGGRWIAGVACEMLQKSVINEGAKVLCACGSSGGPFRTQSREDFHLCPTLSVPGCHAGDVQSVTGRNGPSGVLQVERRYLCFY